MYIFIDFVLHFHFICLLIQNSTIHTYMHYLLNIHGKIDKKINMFMLIVVLKSVLVFRG